MTRRGLVLGGGGVLGAAWMVGALTALEDHLGVDVRSFDQMVGTSAGSVLCSLLASGVSVAELRTHQMEGTLSYGRLAGFEWDYEESTGGDRPPAPRAGFGSTCVAAQGNSRAAPAAADGRPGRPVARGPGPARQRRRPGAPRRGRHLGGARGAHRGGARLRPRRASAVRASWSTGGRGTPRRSWRRAPSLAGTSR